MICIWASLEPRFLAVSGTAGELVRRSWCPCVRRVAGGVLNREPGPLRPAAEDPERPRPLEKEEEGPPLPPADSPSVSSCLCRRGSGSGSAQCRSRENASWLCRPQVGSARAFGGLVWDAKRARLRKSRGLDRVTVGLSLFPRTPGTDCAPCVREPACPACAGKV